MATKRKKRKSALAGFADVLAKPTAIQGNVIGRDQLSYGVMALGAANYVSSLALGNDAAIPGIVLLGIGIFKKNLYLTMAGAGMMVAREHAPDAATPATTSPANVNGMDGFDFASYKEKVKERAKNYMLHVAEKFHLPMPASTVSGMGETDNVNYFVNPYNQSNEIDLSELDKYKTTPVIQQAAQVTGTEELEERNF